MSEMFEKLNEAFKEHRDILKNVFSPLKDLSRILANESETIHDEENKSQEEENKEESSAPETLKNAHVDISDEDKKKLVDGLKILHSFKKSRNFKITKVMKHYDQHFDILKAQTTESRIKQRKAKYQELIKNSSLKIQIELNYLLLKLIYLTSSGNSQVQNLPVSEIQNCNVNICNIPNESKYMWSLLDEFENLKSESEFEAIISKADKLTQKMCDIDYVERMDRIKSSREIDEGLASELNHVFSSLNRIKSINDQSESMLFSKSNTSVSALLKQLENLKGSANI